MRFAKGLGAAVLVVMLAIALYGAEAAPADTLCKVLPTGSTCPMGEGYAIPTTFEGHTGEAIFKTTLVTVNCISDIKGETRENLGSGSGLKAKVYNLTFESCSGCTAAEAENLGYKAVFNATQNFFTLNAWENNGIPKITFSGCPMATTCVYGAASIVLRFVPSPSATTAAKIVIEPVNAPSLSKQTGSSLACPSTAKWEKVSYELSTPLPVWLAQTP